MISAATPEQAHAAEPGGKKEQERRTGLKQQAVFTVYKRYWHPTGKDKCKAMLQGSLKASQ